jgi:opacity protein-like surface antigen
MKKILLAAAATTIISSSVAFAGAEDMFFLKAQVGANMMSSVKDKSFDVKLKSETNPFLGLGVGYYLMDNVRADLTFEHYFSPTMKKNFEEDGIKQTAKRKVTLDALFINGYVDLFDLSVAKFFAGAGVGMAQVAGKVTLSAKDDDDSVSSISAKLKKQNNFAYALHVGAATEFAPGINGELSYSWKDFGKTSKKAKGFDDVGSTALKGHHVGLGIRFDM